MKLLGRLELNKLKLVYFVRILSCFQLNKIYSLKLFVVNSAKKIKQSIWLQISLKLHTVVQSSDSQCWISCFVFVRTHFLFFCLRSWLKLAVGQHADGQSPVGQRDEFFEQMSKYWLCSQSDDDWMSSFKPNWRQTQRDEIINEVWKFNNFSSQCEENLELYYDKLRQTNSSWVGLEDSQTHQIHDLGRYCLWSRNEDNTLALNY